MTARAHTVLAGTAAASLALLVVTAVNLPAANLVEAGRIAASTLVAIPDLAFGCSAQDRAFLIPKIISCADSWALPMNLPSPAPDLGVGLQRGAVASAGPVPSLPSDAR